MIWYVYILKSTQKRWYYVGSTNRLEERVKEHNQSRVKSTKCFTPLKLVKFYEFNDEKGARQYEYKIKKQRTEKERIIREIELE